MNTETVGEAFAEFLTSSIDLQSDEGFYLGELPLEAPNSSWWVIVTGGSPDLVTIDGGMVKLYTFNIFYRSLSGKEIERRLFRLEELLNCSSCVNLTGFETIYSRATQFAQDIDFDNEQRRIGLVQAQVRLFKQNTQIS